MPPVLSLSRSFLLFLFTLLLTLSRFSHSEPTQDQSALLSFLSKVPHAARLRWNASLSACDWVGVTCDPTNSHVYVLRLPGTGLVGQIPSGTIGRLTHLRVLSLRSNRLSGHIPPDFANLTALRNLYLQDNQFSGEFPSGFTRLTRLIRLDLSGNRFSGPIPFSVNNLTHLTGLFLENNNFSGHLPSIGGVGLTDFNVSSNSLNGPIPSSLSRFPASSFAGNSQLCGNPLPRCNSSFLPPPAPAPTPNVPPNPARRSRRKLSVAGIIGIAVAGGVLLLFLLLLCLLLCNARRRRRGDRDVSKIPKPAHAPRSSGAGVEAGTSSSKDEMASGGGEGDRNKLVFLADGSGGGGGGGGGYEFDLDDLLRASAEVLGKGSVGTSYKAVLEDGTAVVVKRLKDVAVARREFEEQMETLGKKCGKHENVVPPRAYYYSKDEKLIVYDYWAGGSLSALLHGSRGSGRTPLDWDDRMKVALGTARGLVHLHYAVKVVHGNIKASNVLLSHNNNHASVSDFGLNPLFGTAVPTNRLAGYRAPEVVEAHKVTFKSDVYSYGVLVLELLTGKAPNQPSVGDEVMDLPRWVQSVVREEWTAEVFDVELMRYSSIEEEMVQLLQIAMACVSTVPDQRPSMTEVLRMIEEIMSSRGGETTDDGQRQSSDDPSKGSDGHTPSAEGRTPITTP